MENSIKAPRLDKTIRLTLAFFTDGIAEEKRHVIPKHCWTWGNAYLKRNKTHGVQPKGVGTIFHSLDEVLPAIEKELKKNEVVLHDSGRK
jgi:hypothetical protein